METLVFTFIIKAVFAVICGMVAQSRGRSVVGWALLGLVLDCIALIILLVIPDLKVEEERQRRMRTENRRLREMVRSNRQLSDQRHEETQRRFSAHDRALGLDTRPPEQQIEGATGGSGAGRIAGPVGSPDELVGRRDEFANTEWYYLENDEKQVGPLAFEDLRGRWRSGEIGALHYVWAPILDNWRRLGEVDGLEEVMRV